jgi:hypothetical protein
LEQVGEDKVSWAITNRIDKEMSPRFTINRARRLGWLIRLQEKTCQGYTVRDCPVE